MSLLLVIAGMAVVVLLTVVCALRSNRSYRHGDDEEPASLWLVPARDPVLERREHEERERGRDA